MHPDAQAHAEQLAEQSKSAASQPEAVQVAVQAQSFQAKAQSLEKAAEAQDLQARAVVHAQAQVEAQAQAHQLVAKAHDHAQACAHASAQADHLKKFTNTSCKFGSSQLFSDLTAPCYLQDLPVHSSQDDVNEGSLPFHKL